MQDFHWNPFDGKSPHSFDAFFSEGAVTTNGFSRSATNELEVVITNCSLFSAGAFHLLLTHS